MKESHGEQILKRKKNLIENYTHRMDAQAALERLEWIARKLGTNQIDKVMRNLLKCEHLTSKEEISLTLCEVYRQLKIKHPEI